VVIHRYLGVVMGLLMLVWFASGVVMLFARWPEVSPEQRAAALAPIDWGRCCRFPPDAWPRLVEQAAVEDLHGHPVLRLDDRVADLATGAPLRALDETDAWSVAATFAARSGLPGTPSSIRRVDHDQWTVAGASHQERPLWKVRLSGPRATDVYVSEATGEVVQQTDAPTRLLAWLGPIPHWLYPEVLRQDPKLWTGVVVWTSLVGVFLTLTGLYLGIVAWRPWRDARPTPFRGIMAWHHVTGLLAGVLTLTWVASGLVSMNPWGFLEGRPDDSARRIQGAVPFGQVAPAILAARGQTVRRLELAALDGQVFLMADGRRLDARGRPAPLSPEDLRRAGLRAGRVAHQEMAATEDAYYHSGHDGPVRVPVWRVALSDGTRLYLDPASGQLRARFDADARTYRWLFEGLHRLDVVPGFDRGAGWTAVMLLLLGVAGTGVATGVWLGVRRVRADVARITRTKA
jgi:hypothetical protein